MEFSQSFSIFHYRGFPISFYPGSKHTTATQLQEEGFTIEDIKAASHISTNKAFMRYFRPSPQLSRAIYASAGGYGMDTESKEMDTEKKEALGL